MKRSKSDIPRRAVERLAGEYRGESAITPYRTMKCVLDGKIVGERVYNQDGQVVIERPIKSGKTHGHMYFWNDDGTLSLVEPYLEGKVHGVAKQYGRKGKIIGKYKLVHGTGFDIWRQESLKGSMFVSELDSLRDGVPESVEWWFLWMGRKLSH